jgi:integrase
VTARRIEKLHYMWSMTERGIGTDFQSVGRDKIEAFLNKLNRNEFHKLNGKLYSGSAKSDQKKFLKQLFKWLRGNNDAYPPEVAWIKTKIGKDEKPKKKDVLTLEELKRFCQTLSKPEHRIMVYLMFDCGFRIDELLSVRKIDPTWELFDPKTKECCFWIKCNRSKTIPRKVPVPLFTEDIRLFKNSAFFSGKKDTDPLFDLSYSGVRMELLRNCKRFYGVDKQGHPLKLITPHCLRHSSVTYYAVEYDGDTVMLAQRYGWTYSAQELQVYVRDSGTRERQGVKKIEAGKMEELQQENKLLSDRLAAQEQAIRDLQQSIAFMKKLNNVECTLEPRQR